MEHWEASWNRDVLERIVALLFSLAHLADLAAGAPFLRRRRVLGILSHGEAEARAFLFGTVDDAPVPAGTPAEARDRAGDAARLAVRLRALALMLYAMLAQAPSSALPGMAGPRADRPSRTIFRPTVRWLNARAMLSPDTS